MFVSMVNAGFYILFTAHFLKTYITFVDFGIVLPR